MTLYTYELSAVFAGATVASIIVAWGNYSVPIGIAVTIISYAAVRAVFALATATIREVGA